MLALLLLFFVGISAAFAQENMQSSAGEFVYPFEKAEKKEENIILKQVDLLAGDLVSEIADVFFYPVLTFEKVGDQPSQFIVNYSEGYKEGDIITFDGGIPANDEEGNRTKFVFRKSEDGKSLELKLLKQGSYSDLPANPVKLTGGNGQGAFANVSKATPQVPVVPLVVAWLVVGAIFFTVRMGFINFRGFKHAVDVVRGKFDSEGAEGEVSHFQALSSALSATVGLGNIAGVAIAVSLGGPGAIFWMIVAGFLGMSSKFTECTLGQKYRTTRADGRVMGGAMFYLQNGLAEVADRTGGVLFRPLGKFLAVTFAILCIGGSFGGGNTFQVNQSLNAVQESIPWLGDHRWVFGLIMTILTGLVIIGGIKRIAQTAEKIVPTMCAVYMVACIVVLLKHIGEIPAAFGTIFDSAFNPGAAWGGFIGVLVQGFKRAAFSNEAGVGSAAIAHSAAKTKEPVREGIVALLEPFIDTIIICTMTGLVIVITGHYEGGPAAEVAKPYADINNGAGLTSTVFASEFSGFQHILSAAVVLFAFSTMISWSYYGERCWAWLFGDGSSMVYRILFLVMVFLGSIITSTNILDFGDLMILGMAFPNVLGLYFLAGGVKKDLDAYMTKLKKGEFEKTQ